MPDFAACLSGLLDELALDRPHLLGHSWGTALALELYRQRPAAIGSLVLVGAYAGWAGSLPPVEVEQRLQFALRAAEMPVAFDPRSMPGLFSEVMPADAAAELAEIMTKVHPAGTRTMARALAECDLREMLPTVSVPTLLLYGADDQRSPLRVADALHAALPRSTLVVLPDLGHMCFLESPDRFAAELRTFLERTEVVDA
jgi:pimeloyl-ACP methyl ester carboxylesterase